MGLGHRNHSTCIPTDFPGAECWAPGVDAGLRPVGPNSTRPDQCEPERNRLHRRPVGVQGGLGQLDDRGLLVVIE